MYSWILGVFTVALVLVWHLRREARRANPRNLPYPPGPPAKPLIGNVLEMPMTYQWRTYTEWSKKYGDIMHLKALDKHILVVSSFEAAKDLFDRRSAKYSSRPRQPMFVELMGWGWSFSQMGYTPEWREYRRAFHQFFHQSASLEFRPTQITNSRRMLQNIQEGPDIVLHHMRFALAATIIKEVYDLDIQDLNDIFIVNAGKVLEGASAVAITGSFLVDTIPILKHVPSWMPGAGFKRKAKEWRDLLPDAIDKPFDDVCSRMANGSASPCVATELQARLEKRFCSDEARVIAKNVAALAYMGKSAKDTIAATLQTLIFTIALYPEIQRKAQAQLDSVVGTDRLPEFEDIDSLPYITAIVKELLRWRPVVPLGNPHATSEDDEYRGYFIPKGTIVMGNAWQILHDENVYHDPMSFLPERFLKGDGSLDPDVRDPTVTFGFGRRICPGRHMAMDTILMFIASILTVFNIRPCEDENGEPITREIEVSSGQLAMPLPFKCKITPRSDKALKLIQQGYMTSKA